MRPTLKFLNEHLIKRIISEAGEILKEIGVHIHNDDVLSLLADHGAVVDNIKKHVLFKDELIDKSLKSAKSAFKLYNIYGDETHHFTNNNVYFTPGSAALNILDYKTGKMKKPVTDDYITYVKVVNRLENIQSQSTAFIPSDVHENISDSYRLFLSLLFGEKPVVTGTFTKDSFNVMKDLQLAVRGSEKELADKPLTIFSCCPTSPLKWSDVTSQNVIDCARHMIPIEFISMPLSGFMAPVSLIGTLVQHTAETLSGIVISQLANPGAPFLYGGSPAIFDVRYETTPMGAIETMMIDCAYNEIGKFLGLPTQAYISLSDAKQLDAQAGLESGMGATLAALSGINNISGPGMLDFESCQSLEKLVLDNEICGMTVRLLKGIEPKEDFPALPLFQELIKEQHLLISKHTRKYLKSELTFPSVVIDRANRGRWEKEGGLSLVERAAKEISKHLTNYKPSKIPDTVKQDMINLMKDEALRHGQDKLPDYGDHNF
jgi:trimethylamine--corrinoid protein Co-methyltransferase